MVEGSAFYCDTCQLEALEPAHMVFEWFRHEGCDCRDGFKMVHADRYSPFGDCNLLLQENHPQPRKILRAPVELLGQAEDPRRAELYSYVRHNRPDLIRLNILRWVEQHQLGT